MTMEEPVIGGAAGPAPAGLTGTGTGTGGDADRAGRRRNRARTGRGGAGATGATKGAGGDSAGDRSLPARIAGRLGGGALRTVLILVGLFWLMPTIGLLLSSLRGADDIAASGWWEIFTKPSQLTLENYANLLDNHVITNSLLSTVLITVPATLLVVVIGSFAGYAFAWLDFPGRDWWFVAVVALLVVPVQVALIPVSKLFGAIGIFETTVGVILFHVAFGLPFAIFLLRNFFAEIPRELLEAARLDGAGEIRLFTRVVMPLGGPAIASLGIFQFLWVWNDMLVALVFADSKNPPITVALQQQVRQFGNNVDVLAPGAFLSMIIPLAVFFAFQRQFVSGVMAGAVK
jgi:alpha-glucoside transport system permease protein